MNEIIKLSANPYITDSYIPLEGKGHLKRQGIKIENVVSIGKIFIGIAAVGMLIIAALSIFLFSVSTTALVVITISAFVLFVEIFIEAIRRLVPHLPSPIAYTYNIIRGGCFEIFAILTCIVLYLWDLTRSDPKEKGAGHQPILLVHGYIHNSSGWRYVRYRMKKMGAGPIFTINLGDPITFKSIEDFSKKVAEKVKLIEEQTGRSDICLIGHSMGGLVNLNYAMKYAPDNKKIDVITIGSPLEGTYVAYAGFGKCAKEMRYGSDFVQKLNAELKKTSKLSSCTYIGTQTDEIVIPPSSEVPLSFKNAKRFVIDSCGHIQMLFNDRIIETAFERYISEN